MEIQEYDVVLWDGVWKQYVSLAVAAKAAEFISEKHNPQADQHFMFVPLSIDFTNYTIPTVAVFVVMPDEAGTTMWIREYDFTEWKNETDFPPVKEYRFKGAPAMFSFDVWSNQLRLYADKLISVLELAKKRASDEESKIAGDAAEQEWLNRQSAIMAGQELG